MELWFNVMIVCFADKFNKCNLLSMLIERIIISSHHCYMYGTFRLPRVWHANHITIGLVHCQNNTAADMSQWREQHHRNVNMVAMVLNRKQKGKMGCMLGGGQKHSSCSLPCFWQRVCDGLVTRAPAQVTEFSLDEAPVWGLKVASEHCCAHSTNSWACCNHNTGWAASPKQIHRASPYSTEFLFQIAFRHGDELEALVFGYNPSKQSHNHQSN